MAMTVTLADLRAAVLDRADMTNGGPVDTTGLDSRINAALRTVYAELKKKRGDEYFGTDTTITTSGGTQEYALPNDFLNVSAEGVWWMTGTGVNIPIHKYTPNESQLQITGQGWTYYPYGSNIRYRLRVGNIRFLPTPLGTYSVKLNYLPTPPILTSAGQTWDGYQGFQEAVIWLATAYCLAKEESDTSFAMSQYAREMQTILENAERDENEPPQVQWADPVVLYGDDHY
jgi:hypothetical protein